MKKILNILLISIVAMFTLNSCDDIDYPQNTSGEGKLSTASLKINVVNSEEVINTRSNGVDVNDYTVDVVNKTTNDTISWKYGEMPEIVTLPVGEYKVEVYNAALSDAAWDSPYYYASKDFTIVKDEITELGNLTCKLANVKVTIKYTDELKELIGEGKDVKVNVSVGDAGSLDFDYGETRAGYFRFVPGSPTLVATFTGTIDGFLMSDFKVLDDITAGQHRIITFGVNVAPDPGQEYGTIGTSGFMLNAKVTRIDLTRDIPVTEEPVDPDDMLQINTSALSFNAEGGSKDLTVNATAAWTVVSDQSWCTLSSADGAKGKTNLSVSVTENTSDEARTAKLTFTMGSISQVVAVNQAAKGSVTSPTITSTSLNLDGVNVITDGMTATVDILAPKGIAQLNVTIDSPSLTPDDLQEVGLSDHFDLANPGSLKEPLSSLGFPVGDQVVGKKSLLFDISQFMGVLNQFKGEHHFIINVVDADGQSVTATLKFLAQ